MQQPTIRAVASTIALGAFALLGACGTNSTSPAGTGMVTMQLTDAPFLIDPLPVDDHPQEGPRAEHHQQPERLLPQR